MSERRLERKGKGRFGRAQVRKSASRGRIGLSWQATALVTTMLNAIVTDPHPEWRATEADRIDHAEDLKRRIPEILVLIESGAPADQLHSESRQIEPDARRMKRVQLTTYEILHWFEKNLSALCPIEK